MRLSAVLVSPTTSVSIERWGATILSTASWISPSKRDRLIDLDQLVAKHCDSTAGHLNIQPANKRPVTPGLNNGLSIYLHRAIHAVVRVAAKHNVNAGNFRSKLHVLWKTKTPEHHHQIHLSRSRKVQI